MQYRLYIPSDFAALYAIEEICFQPPLRFSRAYMRRLIQSQTSATWIAEEENDMAGFAIVEWSLTTRGVRAYIPTIEVTPVQRKKGVGRELLSRLEDSAQEAGAATIDLHVDTENAGAIHLYESRGYTRMGKDDHFYAPGRGAFLYRKTFPAPKAAAD
jgi:ribosomal protein S18 acetylase RimI-like enzyme